MYFKRLELYGFKSFVHKTSIDFVPGVTVIGGPNGGGKSNLLDAVRWVLGEQNPRLIRAGRMEEVIFTGSASRRGVGRTEVTLTIDNTAGQIPLEFSEIAVARRLFRSGESEYLLNGVKCLLRDVQKLWWESGLVTFVGQGEVEELVLAGPQQRRVFLEKVIGLEKYEARKREAQKKLEQTEQDIIRLQDLLVDINLQLEPLAGRREVALRYRECQEQLQKVQFKLAWQEWLALQEQQETVASRLAEGQAAAARLEIVLAGLGDQEELVAQLVQEQEEELRKLRKASYHCENKINTCQAQRRALANEKESLSTQEAGYSQEGQKWHEKEMSLRAHAEELSVSRSALERRQKELQEELRLLREELDLVSQRAARVSAAGKAGENRLVDLSEQLSRAGDAVSRAREQWARLRQERADQEKALAEAASSLASVTARLADLQEHQKRLQEAVALAMKRRREQEDIWQREQELLDAGRGQAGRLRVARERLQARLDLLRQWQVGFQGYSRGPRAVLQANLAGVVGAVADIFTVAPGAEAAIEAALGAAAQYIVVRTPGDARKAIEFLRKSGAGRATFLPLTIIQPRYPGRELLGLLQWPGVKGLARDFVETTPDYLPVVLHLLGDIPMVEDLDVALRVARKLSWRAKIVTLGGEVINPGGSVAGGSRGAAGSGLLSRAVETRKVEEELATVSTRLARLEEEVAAAGTRWKELETGVRAAQEEAGQAAAQLQALAQQEEFWLAQRRSLEERQAACRQAMAALEEQVAAAAAELEKKQLQYAGLENDYLAARQDSSQWAAQHGREIQDIQELQEKVSALQLELVTVQQQAAHTEQTWAALERQAREAKAEKDQYTARLEQVRRRRQEVEQADLALEQQMLELEEQQKAYADGGAEIGQVGHDLQLQQVELQKRRAAAERRREAGRKQLHELEIEQARLASSCSYLAGEITRRFGCEPDRRADLEPADRAELQTLAQRLEEEIAGLGEVNPGAVEEYERLEERASFLQSQYADLQEGRQAVCRVIEQVTASMEQKFLAELQRISTAFNEFFAYLFGGGRASLTLTAEESPLEAGVEIAVQLPGKKDQSITLLSGGEKSLTAIALLLAGLQAHPSPCSIFDEIDASLDDANVERFARLIKEMAGQQQFIVVTHRLGTMEIADVLYGVTMEEPGLSRVYSLNLADATRMVG